MFFLISRKVNISDALLGAYNSDEEEEEPLELVALELNAGSNVYSDQVTKTMDSLPWGCDFGETLETKEECDMTQDSTDTANFHFLSGGTVTARTGPHRSSYRLRSRHILTTLDACTCYVRLCIYTTELNVKQMV